MEELRNINELLFNIKKKITDAEYIEFNKNLLILYKKQQEIDTKPLRESQHSLRQYYREDQDQAEQTQAEQTQAEQTQEEEPNHSWYVSDTDTDNSDDGEVESFYN
tara:strand:+ start:704 stop:1021 length:318 start_codon:yes stop_codon:yes gene_type:complete